MLTLVELLAKALRNPGVDRLVLPLFVGVERLVGVGWGCSVHCWVLREHAQSGLLGLDDVSVEVSRFPRNRFGVIPQTRVGVWSGAPVGVVVLGWLFENCTVDASIFVVKLLRAHGGCLGIRSR